MTVMAVNGRPVMPPDPEDQARRWRALLHGNIADLARGATPIPPPTVPLHVPGETPVQWVGRRMARHLDSTPPAGPWWARAWASPLVRDVAAVLAVLAVTLAAAALIAAVTILAWSAP